MTTPDERSAPVSWRDRATVTIDEAAAILEIGRSSAYLLVRSGDIPTIRLGRRYLVPVARLRAMLGETPETVNAPRLAGRDALR